MVNNHGNGLSTFLLAYSPGALQLPRARPGLPRGETDVSRSSLYYPGHILLLNLLAAIFHESASHLTPTRSRNVEHRQQTVYSQEAERLQHRQLRSQTRLE